MLHFHSSFQKGNSERISLEAASYRLLAQLLTSRAVAEAPVPGAKRTSVKSSVSARLSARLVGAKVSEL
jgi:hypothetical protein